MGKALVMSNSIMHLSSMSSKVCVITHHSMVPVRSSHEN